MTETLHGKDFVALRRLSTRDDTTLAAVGETCERVPAAPGGTVTEALQKLLASGKIAPAPEAEKPKAAKRMKGEASDGR